ncbi:hypothetical protein [Thalassoporum mexicanum]
MAKVYVIESQIIRSDDTEQRKWAIVYSRYHSNGKFKIIDMNRR